MRSITSYLDFTLILQQADKVKSLYEIRFGDELLGSIHMPRLWSDRAEEERNRRILRSIHRILRHNDS